MSFARGDLARRAAIADDLALPEPWGANDDERVLSAIRRERERFRKLGITDEQGRGRVPDFLLDYENLPPKKPTALDRAHTRPSVATRWDQNGNLVETSADTLRLQRDPKTGEALGLLYEPKRVQQLSDPQNFDPASTAWRLSNCSITTDAGTAKGLSYDKLTENTTTSSHFINEVNSQNDGDPVAESFILKADGRNFCYLEIQITDGTNNQKNKAYFDLSNGVTGQFPGFSNATTINHSIKDFGGGWYKIKVAVNPDSNWNVNLFRLGLANGDGSSSYTGDGSSGILLLHAQKEVSREVTTPILQGGAVREADRVDYRFDFPDKTTGVAYSIEQQAAGNYSAGEGGEAAMITFGQPFRHGVIAYEHGVNCFTGGNTEPPDGWRIFGRNSDDSAECFGREPNDETIGRFAVDPLRSFPPHGAQFVIRQIAIHTEPHTDAQLSDLESNYLTQP